MANNKTITIEHIIAKLDNDFNPDGSDWIPRVPAWCVDAMNELKVLRKVDKKMKLTVINKIAKVNVVLLMTVLKYMIVMVVKYLELILVNIDVVILNLLHPLRGSSGGRKSGACY